VSTDRQMWEQWKDWRFNEEISKPKLYLLKVQTKNLVNDVKDLLKAVKDGDETGIKNELDQVKFRVGMLRKKGLGLKESVNESHTITFSKEEMAQLHNDGQIEKDGHKYVYAGD